MKIAVINENACDQSPFCVSKRVCPVNAIRQEVKFFKGSTPTVDKDLCTGCGKCVQVCPHRAIKMINRDN